jgi:hypothetical protein
MRRQLVSLAFAGLAGLASLGVAPVGSDRTSSASANAGGTVAVQHANLTNPAIRDEAAMILVGTFLIGLAAAVRRAA